MAKRDESEMDRAAAVAEVQNRLLLPPPSVEGAELAVSWRPFGTVGGDFYDFAVGEEQSLAITLGDIAGKGYDAALLMVYALAEIRARLRSHQRLAHIMSQLDVSLRQYSSESKYAEVFLGTYLVPMRRFLCVQGGSICPFVFHYSTGNFVSYYSPNFRIPGLPIPQRRGQEYGETVVELERGDVLLLFTDGIGEREDHDGEQVVRRDALGVRIAPSIKGICEARRDASATEIQRAICSYVDGLDSRREDDETLVVLKAG